MPALYKAGVLVTQLSEHREPHVNEEVLGANAAHIVFGEGITMGGDSSFDLVEFLGRKPTIRVTTFTDAAMMRDHMNNLFGLEAH